jgi:light-regulated signal transduction histidine kinase (bacteriophytochrome)
MWIASNTDIHEQKETEDELRRANEDLQQFAYSASHDLQEPIRNVAVYSEIVAKRYDSVLDPDGRGPGVSYRRRAAAGHPDRRFAGVHEAGLIENSSTRVDASATLSLVLSSLAETIRQCDARVTCDALPEVAISQTHLQRCFRT